MATGPLALSFVRSYVDIDALPFVNAEVATEYVLGLQDGPATRDEIQATAACKHILMYDSQTVRLNAEFRCGKSRPNAALGNSPRPTRTIGTSRGRICSTVRDDALPV